MSTTSSSSSWPGRRPHWTRERFLRWHTRWTDDLVVFWGSTGRIKVEDYAEHWPYSLRSLYYYRHRFLQSRGSSTE